VRKSHQVRGERGYVLLALLLIFALMAIAAAVIVPTITFEVRRDREEELIHRGIQYTRAIRTYSAKTGRFPLKLEDLQDANGVRYIRKLYKDPITKEDFKLLHIADMAGVGIASASLPVAQNPSLFQKSSTIQIGASSAQTPASQTQAQPASDDSAAANPDNTAQGSSPNPPAAAPGANNQAGAGGVPSGWGTGGAIFGVASKSKDQTIREFNHKNHYNDWLFFYYPPYGGGEFFGPTSLTMTGNSLSNGIGQVAPQQPGQNPGSPQGQIQVPVSPQGQNPASPPEQ